MQVIKHVVHYRMPKKLQWDKEFDSKLQAHAFMQAVEQEGGVAIYMEHVEDDDMEIGATPKHEGESE